MKAFWVLLVVQKNLEVGEVLSVDISCIVAMTTTIDVQIKYNGPVRRAVFGVRVFLIMKFAFHYPVCEKKFSSFAILGSYLTNRYMLYFD